MLSFCIFLFISTVYGIKAIPDDCNQGEIYWCRSFETAQQCESLPHCSTVWRQPVGRTRKFPYCHLCQIKVKFIESLMRLGKSNKEIEQLANERCSWKTHHENVCRDVVSTTLNLLTDGKMKTRAKEVCSNMKYCEGRRIYGASACRDCQVQAHQTQRTVVSMGHHLSQVLLDQICHKLQRPEAQSICSRMTRAFISEIVHLMKKSNLESICQVVNTSEGAKCTVKHEESLSTDNTPTSTFLELGSTPELCGTICELAVQKARELLTSNLLGTEAAKLALDVRASLCGASPTCPNKLPAAAVWLSHLLNKNPATSVCREIQQCRDPSPRCSTCILILGQLKYIISDNATVTEILYVLHEICHSLKNPQTSAACLHYVNTNIPPLINWLATNINPQYLCALFGLCGETKLTGQLANVDAITCELCVQTLNEAKAQISNPDVQNTVTQKLLDACSSLPYPQSYLCKAAVNNYAQEVYNLVANMDSNVVCQGLHVCPSLPVADTHPLQNLNSMKTVCGRGDPNYWCRDVQLAVQCGGWRAVFDCRRRRGFRRAWSPASVRGGTIL